MPVTNKISSDDISIIGLTLVSLCALYYVLKNSASTSLNQNIYQFQSIYVRAQAISNSRNGLMTNQNHNMLIFRAPQIERK